MKIVNVDPDYLNYLRVFEPSVYTSKDKDKGHRPHFEVIISVSNDRKEKFLVPFSTKSTCPEVKSSCGNFFIYGDLDPERIIGRLCFSRMIPAPLDESLLSDLQPTSRSDLDRLLTRQLNEIRPIEKELAEQANFLYAKWSDNAFNSIHFDFKRLLRVRDKYVKGGWKTQRTCFPKSADFARTQDCASSSSSFAGASGPCETNMSAQAQAQAQQSEVHRTPDGSKKSWRADDANGDRSQEVSPKTSPSDLVDKAVQSPRPWSISPAQVRKGKDVGAEKSTERTESSPPNWAGFFKDSDADGKDWRQKAQKPCLPTNPYFRHQPLTPTPTAASLLKASAQKAPPQKTAAQKTSLVFWQPSSERDRITRSSAKPLCLPQIMFSQRDSHLLSSASAADKKKPTATQGSSEGFPSMTELRRTLTTGEPGRRLRRRQRHESNDGQAQVEGWKPSQTVMAIDETDLSARASEPQSSQSKSSKPQNVGAKERSLMCDDASAESKKEGFDEQTHKKN